MTLDGSPLTLPASVNLIPGTQHTLSAPQIAAVPGQARTRWVFKSWSNGAPASFSFTAGNGAAPAAYAVTYGEQNHLTVGVSPSTGGTVSVTPSSADGFYDLGSQVTLTATPVWVTPFFWTIAGAGSQPIGLRWFRCWRLKA